MTLTFSADGTFDTGDPEATYDWSTSGSVLTFSIQGNAIGTFNYGINGNTLTLSGGTSDNGADYFNGNYTKQGESSGGDTLGTETAPVWCRPD